MATLKNLPRFLYEEVGSHCDNATLTSLISVCVSFYFLFSGFHLNHLYMAEISEKVVSFLHGLRYRSPRLLPHFKAIKTAKIHCEDWKWPEEDVGLGQWLLWLLRKMSNLKSLSLELVYPNQGSVKGLVF
ncbi:hypothetical protein EDB82DRAFT_572492 [Fusarium venenatum]|uniref:uncharacterized protein n=1 Tax=Fusarium venenatum TaxID=56646 RepID=UPI001D4A4C58|nr:hypothetical protein EDB82DRAFT_572492 [Fusarium venenatum]